MKNDLQSGYILFAWNTLTGKPAVTGAIESDKPRDIDDDSFVDDYMRQELKGLFHGVVADRFFRNRIVRGEEDGLKHVSFTFQTETGEGSLVNYVITQFPTARFGSAPLSVAAKEKIAGLLEKGKDGWGSLSRLAERFREQDALTKWAGSDGGSKAAKAGAAVRSKDGSRIEPTKEDRKTLDEMRERIESCKGLDPAFFNGKVNRSAAGRGYREELSIEKNGETVCFVIGFTIRGVFFARKIDGNSPHLEWNP